MNAPLLPALLIVDDDRDVARALARSLAKHAVVTIAESGAEALALLREGRRFDLVLSDVTMPGMTGPELLDQAAIEVPDIEQRFVFMTGGANPHQERRIAVRGVACLAKPVDVAAIRDRLAASRA